jgi:hypothetical protein
MYLLVDQQTFKNVPKHPDLPYLDLVVITPQQPQQIPLGSIEFRSNYRLILVRLVSKPRWRYSFVITQLSREENCMIILFKLCCQLSMFQYWHIEMLILERSRLKYETDEECACWAASWYWPWLSVSLGTILQYHWCVYSSLKSHLITISIRLWSSQFQIFSSDQYPKVTYKINYIMAST